MPAENDNDALTRAKEALNDAAKRLAKSSERLEFYTVSLVVFTIFLFLT
jgi:hypothetical protein